MCFQFNLVKRQSKECFLSHLVSLSLITAEQLCNVMSAKKNWLSLYLRIWSEKNSVYDTYFSMTLRIREIWFCSLKSKTKIIHRPLKNGRQVPFTCLAIFSCAFEYYRSLLKNSDNCICSLAHLDRDELKSWNWARSTNMQSVSSKSYMEIKVLSEPVSCFEFASND